jgi:amidohydrolase
MRFAVLVSGACLLLTPARGQNLEDVVRPQISGLAATYEDLHRHPELSRHEEKTSAFLAGELRRAGYEVTEHVGKYPDGGAAYGVVAVMRNGSGPTLLIRTDMDALPVTEKTGLPYASAARARGEHGQEVGVMHACGHDIHMTVMLGVARSLAELKNDWHGTLMLIGQPSEERVEGARAMLADHLYERFGRPNYAIALHDDSNLAAGTVGVVSGPLLASSTSVDVWIRGVGGHGAYPNATKDPIVAAAQYILAIQTIVSRQNSPLDPAVVTVGDIHGGSKRNVIPDEVKLELTVRTYSEQVRENILSDLSRTARGIALAAGIPEDRSPIVKVIEAENVPATYNDPGLAARLRPVFAKWIGKENVLSPRPGMGSEDFGLFGLDNHEIPTFMLRLGAVAPEKVAESRRTGQPLPSLHSSSFAPLPEPTIRTGVLAMTAAALNLLKP